MSTTSELAGAAEQLEQQEVLREVAAQRRRAGLQRLIDRILLTGAVLLLWELIVLIGWLHPFFISQPSRIVSDLSSMILSGYIFPHLVLTLYEALAGLALGTLLGMALGFLAALSPRLADALQPLLVAFNSMPRIAIAPLFIIWFGFGAESKIALTAMVVFFVTFFNTFAGVRSVDPVLVNSIRAMGGSPGHVVRMVLLPVTLAWVFAALKTSISLALVSAVVTEFVGSMAGIGWIMVQASGSLNTTRLFSTMIVLAIVGALFFGAVRWVEDHALRWRPDAQL
jgi:NitT/TauT family transport system permease protein